MRRINSSGTISTVAGIGTFGYGGDGGQATAAKLASPGGLVFDASGNLYIAEYANNTIRKITTAGIISTIAGNYVSGFGYTGDGGQATAATLHNPWGLAFDTFGNLYIADYSNNVVRMVNTLGIINTFAGTGAGAGTYTCCYSGDGGPATTAGLDQPAGLTFDASDNLYIADARNNVIRKVNTTGIISTFAGNGTGGFGGNGGQASAAELQYPLDVTFDVSGNLYIADYGNSIVRLVNTSGIISIIAGNGVNGYSGDGGQAIAAELERPTGVMLDGLGNLYITDENNNRVRVVSNMAAGIEQFTSNNEQVSIYPNPASTSLSLTLSEGKGTYSISIYDMVGNTVKQSIIYNSQSLIDVSDLSEGVYNILIQNSETKINKKVVIVK